MVARAAHPAHRKRDAVRSVAPVRFAELDAVPGDVFRVEQLIERGPLLLVLHVSQAQEGESKCLDVETRTGDPLAR
jgi:hypothetical protein